MSAQPIRQPGKPSPTVPMVRNDLDQTRKFLSYVMDPLTGCCEMRVWGATFDRGGFVTSAQQYSKTLSGWYDNIDNLIVDATRLRGISGYVTYNPVVKDLLGRADNKLVRCKNATKDENVVCFRWFYMDIDSRRPEGVSATDEELAATVARRDLILAEHPDIRSSAMWGKSGNGCWFLARFKQDYPNDSQVKGLYGTTIARVIDRLAAHYSDDKVKVEKISKNPSHVMCIPGLFKCKGSSLTDRPWRLATLDGVGDKLQRLGEVGVEHFDPFAWLEKHGGGDGGPPGGMAGDGTSPLGGGGVPVGDGEACYERDPALHFLVEEGNSGGGQRSGPAGGGEWIITPGDDYNARVTCEDILLRNRWRKHGGLSPDGVQQLTRPGKQDGCSATIGACGKKVHIFTSSVPGLDPDGTYDAYGLMVRLEHGGDFTAATRAIIAGGYGKRAVNPDSYEGVKAAFKDVVFDAGQGNGTSCPIDAQSLAEATERHVANTKIETVYRDHDYLRKLAQLELADCAEAEALKAILARIDGFRVRAFNLIMAKYRQEALDGFDAQPSGDGVPTELAFTDLGNGMRLTEMFGNRIRYCKSYMDWMIYDGKRWNRDELYAIEAMSQKVPAKILTEIPPTRNEETIESYKKWAFMSQSKDRLAACLVCARSMVAVVPNDLDRDPWLLNVQNGTINLKTGEFLKHRADDLITKIAQVNYDPAAKAPYWDKFMLEIMNGNRHLVGYLKRAVGYSITGVIRQHVFFFLFGTGRNGKTSFLNTLFSILGDYANQIDSDLLISQNQTQHPTGLTELEGRRMVSADESDDGRRFAEAQVKRLTGGNMIQARRMNQNFYTFRPTHHLFFAANHRPDIRGMDPGIWRRIKLIPFEVSFDPELPGGRQPDLDLDSKLMAEAPGILNWMLQGCKEWQESGLMEPDAIRAAVTGYQQEMDTLGWFLEAKTTEGTKVILSVLYGEYAAWCKMANIAYPLSIRKFSNLLGDKGYKSHKSNSIVWKLGVRLKTSIELDLERIEAEKEEEEEYVDDYTLRRN